MILFRPLICKEIILEKGSEGLGFSIVGGFGSIHGDLPIYIKEIFQNSAAHKDGKLQKGDQLVSVNDQSLEGLTHGEAVEILKNVNGTVKLVVLGNWLIIVNWNVIIYDLFKSQLISLSHLWLALGYILSHTFKRSQNNKS